MNLLDDPLSAVDAHVGAHLMQQVPGLVSPSPWQPSMVATLLCCPWLMLTVPMCQPGLSLAEELVHQRLTACGVVAGST